MKKLTIKEKARVFDKIYAHASTLAKGDIIGLTILPETEEFRFGCCQCGLVHLIKVKREGENITLQFFREKTSR